MANSHCGSWQGRLIDSLSHPGTLNSHWRCIVGVTSVTNTSVQLARVGDISGE